MSTSLFLLPPQSGGCGSDDLDECHCECHRIHDAEPPFNGLMVEHVGPCCSVCEFCGKRIMIGAMEFHLVECRETHLASVTTVFDEASEASP